MPSRAIICRCRDRHTLHRTRILVDRNGLTDARFSSRRPFARNLLLAAEGDGQVRPGQRLERAVEIWRRSSRNKRGDRAAGWQVEAVGGNVYIISGRTQPGLQVRSQGNQVFAGSDGTFRLQISTPLSEVGVEIGDDRGNRAGFVLSVRTSKVLRRF